jgi:hypothetical protein
MIGSRVDANRQGRGRTMESCELLWTAPHNSDQETAHFNAKKHHREYRQGLLLDNAIKATPRVQRMATTNGWPKSNLMVGLARR